MTTTNLPTNTIYNWILCAIDFWMDSVLGDYITKFAIDYTQSYSTIEREFFKGPHKGYLKLLSTLINVMLWDKGVMKFESHPPRI
jgi:hypothetical protein